MRHPTKKPALRRKAAAPKLPRTVIGAVHAVQDKKAVDVVVSGHTHQAYVCEIDGRLVTSGDKYGTLVTAIDLKLDPVTRDVIGAKAENNIVRVPDLAKDSDQTALLEAYDRLAAPLANRPAGSVTETGSTTSASRCTRRRRAARRSRGHGR